MNGSVCTTSPLAYRNVQRSLVVSRTRCRRLGSAVMTDLTVTPGAALGPGESTSARDRPHVTVRDAEVVVEFADSLEPELHVEVPDEPGQPRRLADPGSTIESGPTSLNSERCQAPKNENGPQ